MTPCRCNQLGVADRKYKITIPRGTFETPIFESDGWLLFDNWDLVIDWNYSQRCSYDCS